MDKNLVGSQIVGATHGGVGNVTPGVAAGQVGQATPGVAAGQAGQVAPGVSAGQVGQATPGVTAGSQLGQASPGVAGGQLGQVYPGVAAGSQMGQSAPGVAAGSQMGQSAPGVAGGQLGQAVPGVAAGSQMGQAAPGVAAGSQMGQAVPGVAGGQMGQAAPGVAADSQMGHATPGMAGGQAGQVAMGMAGGMAGSQIASGIPGGLNNPKPHKKIPLGMLIGIIGALVAIIGIIIGILIFKNKGNDKPKDETTTNMTLVNAELDKAIAIIELDRDEIPEDRGPGDDWGPGEDWGPEGPDGTHPVWVQTLTNYPYYLQIRQYMDKNDINNKFKEIYEIVVKEHTFTVGNEILDFRNGYAWQLDANKTNPMMSAYHSTAESYYRDYRYKRLSQKNNYATVIQIGWDYYYISTNGIAKYDKSSDSFVTIEGTKMSSGGSSDTHGLRIGRSGNTIYVVGGALYDTTSIKVKTYNVETQKVSDEITISTEGQYINLYSGFVVDEEGRMYFSSGPLDPYNMSMDTCQVVRCDLNGKWETLSDMGTLSICGASAVRLPYIMLQQGEYGIYANTDKGLMMYDFATHSTRVVVEDGEYYIWKADGPYVYYVTAPKQKLNDSSSYATTAYFDYSECSVKRLNVLNNSTITINMDEVHQLAAQYSDTFFANYEGTGMTKEDDGSVSPDWRDQIFDTYFVINMLQNTSVITRPPAADGSISKFALVVQIDEAGKVTAKSYEE